MNVANWTSRILLNALIGFSRQDPAWPNPLGDCGWRVSTVEPEWLVDLAGTQQPGRIRPDVVFALRAGEQLLLVECKVGTVQADQLERYLNVEVNRIRAQSYERPLNAVQVVYVGTEPHRASCERSLAETDLPLVVFADDGARLARREINETCLDTRLRDGVPLRGRPPMSYVPLTPDSPGEEAIPEVLRALMGLALDGVHQFDRRTIVERIFGSMFSVLSPQHRRELERPVVKALNSLSRRGPLAGVLMGENNNWALQPDFGGPGGLQFKTAAKRVTESLTELAQQQALDI